MASTDTHTTRTKIDRHGRIIIPADVRNELGIQPGETVTLIVEGGELRLITLRSAIKRAQEIVARHTKGQKGLVDEFIADRRREAERD